MKKIQERSFSHKKIAFFVTVICFVWLQISNANDNEHNYFEDRDQDGLTDQEELALGTDPDNEDSDGDGYSDGVEVESGYDPLDASPIDEPEPVQNEAIPESDANLTKEFFENLEEVKTDELAALQVMANDPIQYENQVASGELDNLELTEDEIASLLEETIEEVNIEDEIVELTDEEINVLDPVEGVDAQSILDEEKKQVEEYFVQVGYILFESAPFSIEDEDDVSEGITSVIGELVEDVDDGDRSGSVEIEKKAENVYEQIEALEVPYVLKDVHKTGLSLMKYSMNQDTDAVFEGDDPLEVMNLLGKAQGVISEFENLEDIVFDLFFEYGIDEFEIPENLQL